MTARPSRRVFVASIAGLIAATRSRADDAAPVIEPYWRTPLEPAGPLPYYVDPAGAAGSRSGDDELAAWALETWADAADGALCFYPDRPANSLIRVYWGQVPRGLGRMKSIRRGEERAAEVYVEPRPARFDSRLGLACDEDPLFRETYVFLTLLHETGHALGLSHTAAIDDVMYFGGDVLGFYSRLRAKVGERADLRTVGAPSGEDRRRLRALYRADPPRTD